MLILQKYITKNVKFRSFWKTLITLKKLTFLKDFGLVLKVSLHCNLLTNEDIRRIFSWFLLWGQTWYENVVTFQMKVLKDKDI